MGWLNISISGGGQLFLRRHRRSGAPPAHSLLADRLILLDFAQHRLDVDDRRAVDGFNGTNSETVLGNLADYDLMKADWIGPIR